MRIRQFPDKQRYLEMARQSNVIPLALEILADMETPVSIMRKIYRNRGPVFLLESMEGGERWGRYSFLSAAARSQIRVYRDEVEIEENGIRHRVAHNNQPLLVLRDYMRPYIPANVAGLPRFWGGLVGYLTYEMVSFFEAIPNKLPPDKPLAHFMVPEEVLIFDNITNTLQLVVLTFLQDNDEPASAFRAAEDRLQTMRQNIVQLAAVDTNAGMHCNCTLQARHAEDEYRRRVEKAKAHIVAGDIIQTVISQPFVCEPPRDLLSLYRAQRYINPSPYLFFIHLDGMALVGSSPETMVRLENGVATLRPIAGTRRRGGSEQEDRALADELLKDEKERAEHLMLVDLGRNDLGRVAETGTVQVTDLMVVERYSHVMHLVSNINCDLRKDCDAWDLIPAVFPTGTLTGAPKVRAMEIIGELEADPRGPYGGAVGYVSFSGNLDMAITIRTATVENGKMTVRAGAGIVADSVPETERVETVNKAMAIQKAMEMLNRGNGE